MFLDLQSIDHAWADDRLLRLLFQNLVVEDRLEIQQATATAWRACLRVVAVEDESRFSRVYAPLLRIWFTILLTPVGTPLDTGLFWSAKAGSSGGYVYNVDKAMLAQDLSLVSVEAVMRGRVAAATALGELLAAWPFGVSTINVLIQLFS